MMVKMPPRPYLSRILCHSTDEKGDYVPPHGIRSMSKGRKSIRALRAWPLTRNRTLDGMDFLHLGPTGNGIRHGNAITVTVK